MKASLGRMRKVVGKIMPAIVGLGWLIIGAPSVLRATVIVPAVPEINPTSAIAALGLIACIVLLALEQRNTSD